MPVRPHLLGMTRDEIATVLAGADRPALRARQLAAQMYGRGVDDLDAVTDLPAGLRDALKANWAISPLSVVRHLKATDGVEKLLVESGDEQAFECVLLPYRSRVSCCLSTQVGCAMGCKFCATGLSGFGRNLSAGEIIAQYFALQALSERRISHVVYMGMGEPLHNYQEVVKSLRLLHEEVGLSYRHITVSTVGLVPQIRQLAGERLPIHLAISLHSPHSAVRGEIMPIERKYSVDELLSACREYVDATGRKVTFEYLLISGITDTPDQAASLARLVEGLPCLVNLIPFNYVDTEYGFTRPSNTRVKGFRSLLEGLGVNVSQRMERGQDIAAACGQLAGQHDGKLAKRRSPSELSVIS